MNQTSTIFKYRDWTNPDHVDILKHKRIYLPSPEKLNDPFDCRITVNLDMLDDEMKIKQYVSNYVITNLRRFQASKFPIEKFIPAMENDLKNHLTEYAKRFTDLYKQKGNLHFGIFCASTIWDNIQMWTYYSQNHTGFCIGFDLNRLLDFIPKFRSAKVMYSKEYPKIDPLITYNPNNISGDFIENCFKSSHSKAIGWKYEKEYRIFSNIFPEKYNNKKRLIQLDSKCFKSLYVGLDFPSKELPIITNLANKLNVPIYKICLIPNKFKLGKTRII